jgi:hypothetical protein
VGAAQEFLKERRVVFPAESALLRLVGEQKKLAHESIVTRIADSFSPEMAETLNRLLDIQPGETVSALQKIKANPAKSSAPAMNALMHPSALQTSKAFAAWPRGRRKEIGHEHRHADKHSSVGQAG